MPRVCTKVFNVFSKEFPFLFIIDLKIPWDTISHYKFF